MKRRRVSHGHPVNKGSSSSRLVRPSASACIHYGSLVSDYLRGRRTIDASDPHDAVTAAMVHICNCDRPGCVRQSDRLQRERPQHHRAIIDALGASTDQPIAATA